MDIDLLFTAVESSDWKSTTENGIFEPETYKQDKVVYGFTGEIAEDYINATFENTDQVLLVVIDPLRIETPVKKVELNGFELIEIQGTFSLDSIIDKIRLEKDKKGKFNLRVKHFD